MKAVAVLFLVLCCLAISDAWNCVEAPRLSYANQIDAGMGQVVATDRYKRAYFLSGSSWYRLGTYSLQHVTVGPSGTWGTYLNRVYKYVAGNFELANGVGLLQVDAGGDGQVVGVGPSPYRAYCLRESYALAYAGVGSVSWSYLSRVLKYYSCGPQYGCWGVDTSSRVYVTKYITPTSCSTSSWTYVSGLSMKMIEVGTDGSVFGVTTTGKVYQRSGISSSRREGTSWVYIPMCMPIKHVTYDLRQLWVVTTSGLVMKCSR
nr:PREDICTED: fish-egg lectin-like [Paralichthys olivaceus]